tara:strand:+ start:2639 stop:3583 length:945 start_codon:yes stop_codon:yes gene_type:complete
MAILVTGSSGYLGRSLVQYYRQHNHDVVGIDRKASPWTDKVGSITDVAFVDNAIRGCDTLIHTAALHKPHLQWHKPEDFIHVNITGTRILLEAAVNNSCKRIVFTSTTSTFGENMRRKKHHNAIWVSEKLIPIPEDIYDVTKITAENLCWLCHKDAGLNIVVLKTSRFFSEDDIHHELRRRYDQNNLKVNEFICRRVDIRDVVTAHAQAVIKADDLGFENLIISSTSPLCIDDMKQAGRDLIGILKKKKIVYKDIYQQYKWEMFQSVDCVYANTLARKKLDWSPKTNFETVLQSMREDDTYLKKLFDENHKNIK